MAEEPRRGHRRLGEESYRWRGVNSNTPRSWNVARANVQTEAKIREDRRWKPLGELQCCGHMKNSDSTNGNTFPDEMEVDFHVLGALVLDGVGGEVDGADTVTVHKGGRLQRVVEFL
jgi:hypothetical protein